MRSLSINRLAYLGMIRNVRRGLVTRTEIIRLLDPDLWTTASEIAKQVNVTYHTVLYHLKNLAREDIVERDPEGRGWRYGPFRQSELIQFLSSKRKRKN